MRRPGLRTGPLEVAICPGCLAQYTRAQLLEGLREREPMACSCDYEFPLRPWRPLTVAEILRGRSQGPCGEVDPAAYVRAVLTVLREGST